MTECSFERLFPLLKKLSVSAILRGSKASLERPQRASVKRSSRSERPEVRCLSEASFADDSERRMRSSEAGAALIFCLLLDQAKSN